MIAQPTHHRAHPDLIADLERAVQALAAEETEPSVLLFALAGLRLNDDETVVADAVELVRARDALIDGSADPYFYLRAEPRAGVNLRDHAIQRCEQDLYACLEVLARPRGLS